MGAAWPRAGRRTCRLASSRAVRVGERNLLWGLGARSPCDASLSSAPCRVSRIEFYITGPFCRANIDKALHFFKNSMTAMSLYIQISIYYKTGPLSAEFTRRNGLPPTVPFCCGVTVGDLELMKWHMNLNHQLKYKISYIQCENRQKDFANPVYIKGRYH